MAADLLDGVQLSVPLEGLRAKPESAWAEATGKEIRFRVSEVALTVEAVAWREVDVGGKIRWWSSKEVAVVGQGAKRTQTLVLTLVQGLYDWEGHVGPINVAADQARPGG